MSVDNGNRTNFASKIGLVLATAGSAVGLGNIWRFPVLAGQNGGGAFLLIYIICIILLGLPLMIAEFMIGRHAQSNTATAYARLTANLLFRNIGKLCVFTGWFILCYYIVVSAWALNYMVSALAGTFTTLAMTGNTQVYADYFSGFVSHPFMPVVYTLLFILMSHLVIVKGVKKGIERFSKYMMPLLFIIMLVLCVSSFFTPAAGEGLSLLFQPDFSKIHVDTVLCALGQAFYSLSLAMGCICTFASYFNRETRLVSTAVKVGVIDSMVAVMSGIVIFPAVFSAHFSVDAGPSLVFIALPNVFQQVFSAIPAGAYIVSVLFYFLLVLATLTSVVSLHEVPTSYLTERFHLSRPRATTYVTLSVMLIGSLCALSMGPLSHLTICDKNLFDLFDFTSGQVLLPVGGLLISVFVGWALDRDIIREQLTNYGTIPAQTMAIIVFLLKYIIPVIILLIFLSGLHII